MPRRASPAVAPVPAASADRPPSAAVTREQMGAFIGVTFSLTLYAP